jgi:SpoVK/Ycf46/Vps4 family AAA+-type ATPase
MHKNHHIYLSAVFIQEAVKMAQPSLTREGFSPIPDVKWEDVGALDHVREEFVQHIVKRIKNPDVYEVTFLILHFFMQFLLIDN